MQGPAKHRPGAVRTAAWEDGGLTCPRPRPGTDSLFTTPSLTLTEGWSHLHTADFQAVAGAGVGQCRAGAANLGPAVVRDDV